LAQQIELVTVRVCRVDDGRARAEATGFRKQLDGAETMLGDALLDLPRLLVRVHVERQLVLLRVRTELLQPVARAGANGVGGDPDADARSAQLLEPSQVLTDGRLPEALDPAPRVRRV
jgi:hypothetical protein